MSITVRRRGGVFRAFNLLAGVLLGSAANLAFAGPANASSDGDGIRRLFEAAWALMWKGAPTWLVLVLSAAASLAPWLAGRLWTEYAQTLAARRTFASETTKRVVELSNTHYWALANAAGTFGQALSAYLRMVETHLFLDFSGGRDDAAAAAGDLRARFRELGAEAADSAFPALARLLYHFDQFQFRGSQTYLLPDARAGDDLRRLYNLLVSQLPADDLILIRRALEQHLKKERKTAADAQPAGIAGVFLEKWTDDPLLKKQLSDPRKRFEAWLFEQLPAVCEASRAGTAFFDVMQFELTELTRPFFRRQGSTPWARSAAWPDGLAPTTRAALDRAALEAVVYRPLGSSYSPQATADPREQQAISPVTNTGSAEQSQQQRDGRSRTTDPPEALGEGFDTSFNKRSSALGVGRKRAMPRRRGKTARSNRSP